MGQYLTHADLRERFAVPLQELATGFAELCEAWQRAYESREIVRPDLLLNDATPETAMSTLRRFLREASGKLQDAIAGVYRYRDAELRRAKKRNTRGRRG